MAWKISTDRPAYIQIVEIIQQRIISGLYKPGQKIKSVRDLAEEAQVNPNTMQRALQELERQGLIYSIKTTGKYVTEDNDLILRTREMFAVKTINEFFVTMSNLGFEKDEVIKLLEKR